MTMCYHYAEPPTQLSTDNAVSWRVSMGRCTMNFKSYLFGDLPRGNESVMCEAIGVKLTGPTWIGIATQIYISAGQGNISCILLSLI